MSDLPSATLLSKLDEDAQDLLRPAQDQEDDLESYTAAAPSAVLVAVKSCGADTKMIINGQPKKCAVPYRVNAAGQLVNPCKWHGPLANALPKCTAKTTQGNTCKRHAGPSGMCTQHLKMTQPAAVDRTGLCCASKKDGTPCKNRAKEQGVCGVHRGAVAAAPVPVLISVAPKAVSPAVAELDALIAQLEERRKAMA